MIFVEHLPESLLLQYISVYLRVTESNRLPIVSTTIALPDELTRLELFPFDEVLGQAAFYSFEAKNTTLHLRFGLRPTVPLLLSYMVHVNHCPLIIDYRSRFARP